jgi:hypothetical protein
VHIDSGSLRDGDEMSERTCSGEGLGCLERVSRHAEMGIDLGAPRFLILGSGRAEGRLCSGSPGSSESSESAQAPGIT